MSTQDFKIVNGLSYGLLSYVSLLTVSSLMSKNVQYLHLNSEQWSYLLNKKLYWSFLVGFPLGFIVGYKQKPLLNIFIPNLG